MKLFSTTTFILNQGYYIPQDKILEDFEVYNDQHTRYNIENKYISIIDTSYKDSIVYTKKLVAFSKEQITCSPQTAKTLTRYSGLDSMKQDIHQKGLIILFMVNITLITQIIQTSIGLEIIMAH